jgi:predicted negative regulator of RcsB-dependent stress response
VTKKLDKHDVKAPDAFVSTSDKIFTFIEHHMKTILALVLLVVIAVGADMALTYFKNAHEEKAAEALYGPEAELRKAETAMRDTRAEKMKELMAKDKKAKPEIAKAADFNADFAPHVTKLQTAIGQNAETKAAMVSALNLSAFLLQQKQFALAEQILDEVKFHPSEGDLLNGLWQMNRGVVYIENKKYDDALAAYQKVLASPQLKYLHPEALLKTGFVQELKGDQAKARETYTKLKSDFPQSEASATAGQYLRLMDLKAQQG